MIGVILWSSPAKEKAVIWCEDHGALAYLQGQKNLAFSCDWPEAGDLVELEFETLNDLRHARAVAPVTGNKRSELPDLLRGIGEPAAANQPSLRVVSNTEFPGSEHALRLAANR
ncbi:hypothetical protein SAMN04487972_11128 [Paracoccus halophilus]|uniref:Uncharacterized protein n=1 Tax=Paracoccus halophilus TaxID=376733 RepID=A0A099F6P4_9RHOB|nr:hypothetical protein [Paracoccus halophilus]KGJ05916.1 hypothetical protein IT41_04400 [Paracoccus halophilus]SFA53583.1 hypothetical protein SAMN04487972_11128 [Paracoccus halophilus]